MTLPMKILTGFIVLYLAALYGVALFACHELVVNHL